MSKPGDHTIVEAMEPLPAQKDQEDGPLYVHFLPRKEYLAAGTPWIVHSRYGCHPVAHVQFESVLGMTTGEGQPPVKVCLCGVSNHHLQVRRASFPECHGTRIVRVSRGCALTRSPPNASSASSRRAGHWRVSLDQARNRRQAPSRVRRLFQRRRERAESRQLPRRARGG